MKQFDPLSTKGENLMDGCKAAICLSGFLEN